MKYSFWMFIALSFCIKGWAFEYDPKDLPKDLRQATDIVIAKKVGGIISYGQLTDEIDSFHKDAINWRESPAWERLQSRNNTTSTFLVLNSIKGSFSVGDEFKYRDGWIPVELGSVNLYFLYKDGENVDSNPCHRIDIRINKRRILELSDNVEDLISFILDEKLSFCAYEAIIEEYSYQFNQG